MKIFLQLLMSLYLAVSMCAAGGNKKTTTKSASPGNTRTFMNSNLLINGSKHILLY